MRRRSRRRRSARCRPDPLTASSVGSSMPAVRLTRCGASCAGLPSTTPRGPTSAMNFRRLPPPRSRCPHRRRPGDRRPECRRARSSSRWPASQPVSPARRRVVACSTLRSPHRRVRCGTDARPRRWPSRERRTRPHRCVHSRRPRNARRCPMLVPIVASALLAACGGSTQPGDRQDDRALIDPTVVAPRWLRFFFGPAVDMGRWTVVDRFVAVATGHGLA